MISSACFTASTYALVAASCACVGSVTFTILELFTSTVPAPFGFSEISPFVSVLVISLPLRFKLSTVNDVSPATSVVVAPGFNEEEPSVIALTATAPLVTVKSVASKEATPLFEVLASSAAIVIVSSDTVVSIPSPPVNVKVPPVLNVSLVPESADSVKLDVTVANSKSPFESFLRNCPVEPAPFTGKAKPSR